MPRAAATRHPLFVLLLALGLGAEAAAPAFDPARCLGRWHVVASTPAAGLPCRSLEFLRDGPEAWVERCLDPPGDALAVEVDAADPRLWRTADGLFTERQRRFFYVSADNRFAAAGDGPESLTLLAREPAIADWHYAGLVARAALQGYHVTALKKEGPARGRP